MLHLQATAVGDPQLSDRLNEASSRITAVGRAYDRLAYNADDEKIDLVGYLRDVLKDLEPFASPCKIAFEAPAEIQFAADRAILVALIVNELVSNAAKYAYPDCPGESIWVKLARADKDNRFGVSARSRCRSSVGFDPTTSKRLGSRLVVALSQQLGAELTRPSSAAGANFTILVPLKDASA